MADTALHDADCSPTTESFPYSNAYNTCYTDPYATLPVISLEFPEGLVQRYQAVPSSVVPNALLGPYRLSFDSASFDQLEQLWTDFPFGPTTTDYVDTESTSISPCSLSNDEHQPRRSDCLDFSPLHLKGEYPPSLEERSTPQPLPRKQGRPRLHRASPDSPSTSYDSPAKSQRTSRVPHNQVERKYREGLNSGLERLRRTVPTLPQCTGGRAVGQPQLSKAMVLVGAVEHIKMIEQQRDALIVEIEWLKGRLVL
jgi:hypothetical protein